MTGLDYIKCLKQIKLKKLLLTCAPMSELPSNISTVMFPDLLKYVQCVRLDVVRVGRLGFAG